MMKQMTFLLLATAVISSNSGCNYKQLVQQSDSDYGSRKAHDPKTIKARAYGTLSKDSSQHNNSFFEYSSMMSQKVSSLNGIASAIVMLTDKNAYVGIMLDWTAVGTKGSGGTEEQNNTGLNGGVYNSDTGQSAGNGRVLVSPYNSYFSVNDHNNLSPELKQTIAELIRQHVPTVKEVHISANMEFVNYFNQFAKEAWGGRSLTPWIDSFNTVVQYHFAGGNVMPSPITQPDRYTPSESQMRR
ncbi:hypothetical protein I6N90_20465 [Paenibacillus sp. GSMTC-2017]|uniref:hypothetical protein n=1 Tax=Paenibacillus sp. GSMTC-2017 TaxID=2794350 RepID=UPI0018D9627F|nr:hypothetical protein [Paenibacillus sp. GSMTC-2017]MBH5320183.1 hypothetical protein [Paenibacillus sp. GSMTC-2017]